MTRTAFLLALIVTALASMPAHAQRVFVFAALDILDGAVIGRNMQRHRHQGFIRFLNTIEAQFPAGKMIHELSIIGYDLRKIKRF